MELIQWPRAQYWDKAWNPIVGCKPCSPACENCYAKALTERFGRSFEPRVTKQRPPRKGVVFCGNMTDLFGEWVDEPLKPLVEILEYPGKSLDATYLWLTKRVCNMIETIRDISDGYGLLRNHYFGFTAENQDTHDWRAGYMALNFPTWANKWMSCEPLLGPIDLRFSGLILLGRPAYDWLVVGCESGPKRRPCRIEWVESIVEQCQAAGVPVFVKQLDIDGKCERDITKFPAHLRIRQVPWSIIPNTKKGETK